jgi:catechol 2,3-dioxygenase-like lactoylglutathione lyase family enzyme
MDNVGIFFENLEATIDFFRELGLELKVRATVEGEGAQTSDVNTSLRGDQCDDRRSRWRPGTSSGTRSR